jgi:hypothetical protein
VTDVAELPTLEDLEALADLVERHDARHGELYVRWSAGPDADRVTCGGSEQSSRDSLTGIDLPGLSANPLRPEPWWQDRSLTLWVARKLYDYEHMRELRGTMVRPWVLVGDQCGRGPDNEPLVICRQPLAWVSDTALRQCKAMVDEQDAREWGPLRRDLPDTTTPPGSDT